MKNKRKKRKKEIHACAGLRQGDTCVSLVEMVSAFAHRTDNNAFIIT